MTDEELIDAYHAASRKYESAKLAHGNRVDAFVQLTSAEMALISRLGSSDYLQRCRQRHEVGVDALVAVGVTSEPPAASALPRRVG